MCKYKSMPGWNEYVKDKHEEARDAFMWWHSYGKPRKGPVFDNMKRCRAQFKYAVRQCKRAGEEYADDAMANTLLSKNIKSFWTFVKAMNKNKALLANSIHGHSGKEILLTCGNHTIVICSNQ